MKHKLVLVRHGESTWNKENRFTGWTDVDLSPTGLQEAAAAAQLIKNAGIEFDHVFTSVLKRALRTMWIVLDRTEQLWQLIRTCPCVVKGLRRAGFTGGWL